MVAILFMLGSLAETFRGETREPVTPLEVVVLIVSDDRAVVEADLAAGRWSARVAGRACWEVGAARGCVRFGPVRGCDGCGRVAVVAGSGRAGRRMCCCRTVPGRAALCRGGDRRGVALVGREGYRRAGERLGVPGETVRDWRRRFRSRAELLVGHFLRWTRALDASLDPPAGRGSPAADAIEAIGVCTRVASLLFGRRSPWSWASALTAGGLLVINTRTPWPVPE